VRNLAFYAKGRIYIEAVENRVLRRIFGHKREEWREAGGGSIMRSFITCTFHRMLLGRSNEGG
jgi:hypothetical protein